MIEYKHENNITDACFAGETDNLRYNWFRALRNEFKWRLPFMKSIVLFRFILKYTPIEKVYYSKIIIILVQRKEDYVCQKRQ